MSKIVITDHPLTTTHQGDELDERSKIVSLKRKKHPTRAKNKLCFAEANIVLQE